MWLRRSRLDASLEYRGCSRGEAWRLLRRLAARARRAALRHRRHVHRVLSLKLDSLPPRVEPGTVFTGQWVGVVEEGDALLVIEPKLDEFPVIYAGVAEALAEAGPLLLAFAGLHLGPQARLPSLSLAARLLEEYIEATPPYIVEEQRLPAPPVTLAKRLRQNTVLDATMLAAAALLSREARRALEALSGADTWAPFLEPLARLSTAQGLALLQQLAPRLAAAAQHGLHEEPDTELLAQLALAARAGPSAAAAGPARLLLAPAPKIYELYVLLRLDEALRGQGWRLVGRSLHRWRYWRRGERLLLHYNRPPARTSRLVRELSGSPPHPDILIEKTVREEGQGGAGPTRVVLDAKYLEVAGRIRLADAIRLLGYAADLARDHELYAAIAAPRVMEAAARHVSERLNGVGITVSVLEASPRRSQLAEIARRL